MKRRAPRAFATIMVIAAVAIAILILSSLQMSSWRQAVDGRETLGRVRAYWAARAGVETVIARLQQEFDQSQPLPTSSLLAALAQNADGNLGGVTYEVTHEEPTGTYPGPGSAHAKINVNLMTSAELMLLPDMTEDVADAIIDWIDADSDITGSGAEVESYGGLAVPYSPRNAPIRALDELKLVLGVRPEYLYGDLLDAAPGMPAQTTSASTQGWSAYITASSTSGGLAPDGQARIDLTSGAPQDVAGAAGVDTSQAQVIIGQASQPGATMADYIRTPLSTLAQSVAAAQAAAAGRPGAVQTPNVANLTRDQLRQLLDTCTIGDPMVPHPGKIDLNVADSDTLEYLSELSPTQRDALVSYRDQVAGDIDSIVDLLDVPQINGAALATLYPFLDTRSNVFQMTSTGKDPKTGLFVVMTAEVDRSTNPVTIRSLTVR